MSEMIEIKNAVIKSTSLNIEEGFLMGWVHLTYGGSDQGFGGYMLYRPKGFAHHEVRSIAGHFIHRVMEIAGVKRWSDLPGKTMRVRMSRSGIKAIGHIVNDDWFNPSDDFKTAQD